MKYTAKTAMVYFGFGLVVLIDETRSFLISMHKSKTLFLLQLISIKNYNRVQIVSTYSRLPVNYYFVENPDSIKSK